MKFRLLIGLLLGAAAWSQVPGDYAPIILSPFPPQLKDYLGLTNDQTGQITALNAAYNSYSAGKAQRAGQVQQEIAEETAKDSLDPMALGVRYAEMEAIRRDLAGRQADVRQKAVALLTAPQRARLKTLEDASKLRLVIAQAQAANLIDRLPVDAVISVIPNNLISVPIPQPVLFAPDLKAYLGLSEDQATTISRLNQTYLQDSQESSLRSAQIQRQIQDETAKPNIDPMMLGSLYAELEYMQRDLRKEQAELRKNVLIVLSGAQRAKLDDLNNAAGLQPRATEAACQNLLESPIAELRLTPLSFTQGTIWSFVRTGCPIFVREPLPNGRGISVSVSEPRPLGSGPLGE